MREGSRVSCSYKFSQIIIGMRPLKPTRTTEANSCFVAAKHGAAGRACLLVSVRTAKSASCTKCASVVSSVTPAYRCSRYRKTTPPSNPSNRSRAIHNCSIPLLSINLYSLQQLQHINKKCIRKICCSS